MKKTIYLLQSILILILFVFTSEKLFAQSKKANDKLVFINNQFQKYNQYGVHFWIDENEKVLKSESQYFIVTYPILDIDNFSFYSKIIKIDCGGRGECISSVDKDDYSKTPKSDNTINLDCDESIGNKVVLAFYDLQTEVKIVWGTQKNIKDDSNLNLLTKDENLNYINSQFKLYNQYGVHFWIDEKEETLKSESKYFIVTYPLKALSGFAFNSNTLKITCKTGECISSFDKDYNTSKNQESFTVNLDVDNEVGQKVAQAFLDLQIEFLLEHDNDISYNNIIVDPQVKQNLDYINKEFKKYNAYDVQFWLEDSKTLKSKSIYFELTYPIEELENVIYENQIIEFKCISGSCITSLDLESKVKTFKDSFSVNYTSDENGNLIARNFNTFIAILKR